MQDFQGHRVDLDPQPGGTQGLQYVHHRLLPAGCCGAGHPAADSVGCACAERQRLCESLAAQVRQTVPCGYLPGRQGLPAAYSGCSSLASCFCLQQDAPTTATWPRNLLVTGWSGCPASRLISCLQLLALVVFGIAYPTILDYVVFLFDCRWTNMSQGLLPMHIYFTDQSELMAQAAHLTNTAAVCSLHCCGPTCFFGCLQAAPPCRTLRICCLVQSLSSCWLVWFCSWWVVELGCMSHAACVCQHCADRLAASAMLCARQSANCCRRRVLAGLAGCGFHMRLESPEQESPGQFG